MELIHFLERLLYEVASFLYLPVIGGCALLVAYIPLQTGATLHECWRRQRRHFADRARFQRLLDQLRDGFSGPPSRLNLEIERLFQSEELQLARRLDRIRFVIKVGPALGLMGTLIPMGISLAALAEGNIPKMAGSMVTAFTATVAGLGAGVAAYLLALLRERWVRADLREMAYAAELAMLASDASAGGAADASAR